VSVPVSAPPEAASPGGGVGRGVLLHVLWRSFFFLAVANYQRMQNVGFGYAILPALKRLYAGDALRTATARHLEFFNSHPYMAGLILGASVRIEEDIAAGTCAPERVQRFKTQMMGPLAAIGDSFFWTSLRPLGAILAIAGVLYGWLWAPLAFIVLYNACHLTLRAYGLFAGYRQAENVVTLVHRWRLVRLADWAHVATGALLGVAAAQFVGFAHQKLPIGEGLEPVLLATLTCITALCIKRNMRMFAVLYVLVAGCLVFVLSLQALFPIL
jgi:PTS system mannose-specific IID component